MNPQEDRLLTLYKEIKGEGKNKTPLITNLPDYDTFRNKLSDEESAKTFFNSIRRYVPDLPDDFDELSEFFELKKKGSSKPFTELYEQDLHRPSPDAIQSPLTDVPKSEAPWLDISVEKTAPSWDEEFTEEEREDIKNEQSEMVDKWRKSANLTSRIDFLLDTNPIGSFAPPEELTPSEKFEWYKRGLQRKFTSDIAYKNYVDYIIQKDKDKERVIGKKTAREYLKELDIDPTGLFPVNVFTFEDKPDERGLDFDKILDEKSYEALHDILPDLDSIREQRIPYKPNAAEYIATTAALSSGVANVATVYASAVGAMMEHGAKLYTAENFPIFPGGGGFVLDVSSINKKVDGQTLGESIMKSYRGNISKMQSFLEQRDASWWEPIAGGFLGLMLDAPLFGVGGKLAASSGVAALSAANWTANAFKATGVSNYIASQAVKKGFLQTAAKLSTSSAGALGFHGAFMDVVQQAGEKPLDQYSFEQTLSAGAWGAGTGAGLGVLGAYTSILTNYAVQRSLNKALFKGQRMTDVLKEAFSRETIIQAMALPVEVGLFELAHVLQGGEVSLQDIGHSAATILLLKSKGIAHKSFTNYKDRSLDITNTEKGVLGVKDLNELRTKYKNKDAFNDFIRDDNNPILTKAKLLYIMKGKYPDSLPLPANVENKNGLVFIRDSENRLLEYVNTTIEPASNVSKNILEFTRAMHLYNGYEKYTRLSSDDMVKVNDALIKAGFKMGVEDPVLSRALFKRGTGFSTQEIKAINEFKKAIDPLIPIIEKKAKKQLFQIPSEETKLESVTVPEKVSLGSRELAPERFGRIEKVLRMEPGTASQYTIKVGDKVVGDITYQKKGKEWIIKRQEVDVESRGAGVAQEARKQLQLEAEKQNATVVSDKVKTGMVNQDAQRSWDAAVKKGIAVKTDDGYKMKPSSEWVKDVKAKKPVLPEKKSFELSPEQTSREQKMKEMWDGYRSEVSQKPKRKGAWSEKAGKERSDKLLELLNIPSGFVEDIKKEAVSKGMRELTPEFEQFRDAQLKANPKKKMADIRKEAKNKGIAEYDKDFAKFVSQEKKRINPYQDIPDRVWNQMTKLAEEAWMSDAKYKKAVQYLDKMITDRNARVEEEDRLITIDKIAKETGKSVYKQQGKKPKLKGAILEGDEAYSNTMAVVNDLITTGKSDRIKGFENPQVKIKENLKEAEELLRAKSLSVEEQKRLNRIRLENEILEFANIEEKRLPEVKEMLDKITRLKANRKLRSQEAGEALMKESFDRNTEMIKWMLWDKKEMRQQVDIKKRISELEMKEELSPKESFELNRLKGDWEVLEHKLFSRTTARPAMYKSIGPIALASSNFYSLQNMFMAHATGYKGGNLPIFNDPLNNWTRPKIKEAMDKFDLYNEHWHTVDRVAMMESLGVSGEGEMKRKLINMTGKRSIDVELTTESGNTIKHKLTPNQAIQKVFQWGDAHYREVLEVPYRDKGRGMGYTQKSIDGMMKQLEPYAKYMNWLKETWDKYSQQVYEPAYIAENGVSFRDMGWNWTGQRIGYKVPKTEIGDYRLDPMIRDDRTKSRIKSNLPLKDGDAHADLLSMVNESIRYASFAKPLKEFQSLYKDPSVRRVIEDRFGTQPLRVMDNRMRSFAGNQYAERVSWVDELNSNLAAGILGLKTAVPIKQLISGMYYGIDMPTNALLKAIPKAIGTPLSPMSMSLVGVLMEDPFFRGRMMTSNAALGLEYEQIVKETVRTGGSANIFRKAKTFIPTRKIKEVAGQGIRIGDMAPIIAMGSQYVEHKFKEYAGRALTEKDIELYRNGIINPHLKRAIDDWSFMSEVGQQSLRIANIQQASLDSSWARMLGLFTSGEQAAHRVTMYLYREAKKAEIEGDMAKLAKMAKGVMITHALSGAIYYLFPGGLKGDKDAGGLLLALGMGNIESLAYIGRLLALYKQYAMDEHYGREGAMPIPLVNSLEDAVKSSVRLYNLATAPVRDWNKILPETVKFTNHISTFLGMPTEGAMKLYGGIKSAYEGDTPVVSWETIGIYAPLNPEFPEDFVKEMNKRGVDVENIGLYKNDMEAVEQARRCMAFELDQRTFKYDEEALKSVYYKAVASTFQNPNINPNVVIGRAISGAFRDRFKKLYGMYDKLNTVEGVDKAMVIVEDRIKKAEADGDNEQLRLLYQDKQDLIDLKFERQDAMNNAMQMIIDGEHTGLGQMLIDRGITFDFPEYDLEKDNEEEENEE